MQILNYCIRNITEGGARNNAHFITTETNDLIVSVPMLSSLTSLPATLATFLTTSTALPVEDYIYYIYKQTIKGPFALPIEHVLYHVKT